MADVDNLCLMMNLLKDPSRSIQFEAFHVFKVGAGRLASEWDRGSWVDPGGLGPAQRRPFRCVNNRQPHKQDAPLASLH